MICTTTSIPVGLSGIEKSFQLLQLNRHVIVKCNNWLNCCCDEGMNRILLDRRRSAKFPTFFCVILTLKLVFCFGCRSQESQSRTYPSPVQNRSSEDIHLSELWEKERAQLNKTSKDYPAKQTIILESLLESLTPEQRAAEFERIRSSPANFGQMSEFDQNLLQVFVITSVQQKEREKLVYLLSGNCPRFIATDAIELYLAFSGIPDPLLVLFDSYAQSQKESVRSDILEILGDAFGKFRREYPNAREFLEASKQWYLSNGNKLKVNPYYQPDSDFSESRDFFLNARP